MNAFANLAGFFAVGFAMVVCLHFVMNGKKTDIGPLEPQKTMKRTINASPVSAPSPKIEKAKEKVPEEELKDETSSVYQVNLVAGKVGQVKEMVNLIPPIAASLLK